MATILRHARWGIFLMLAPKYEVDVTTYNRVMAHFICTHYMPEWPTSLTYLHQNWVTRPRSNYKDTCLFWSLQTFAFLKYSIIKCRFRGPVARQPLLPWQPFCSSLIGGSSSCYPPSMNLTGPPRTELLQYLTWRVTLRCDLDLRPFDIVVMSRDTMWVTKFELDPTYLSRVMTTTIFHWPPA